MPDHLNPHEDEGQQLQGRWVDSQHLRQCDIVICQDGSQRTISSVRLSYADNQRVCNLTVKDHPSYAVGELGILVHNGWCDILKNAGVMAAKLPPNLVKKAIAKGYTEAAVHGHHIVMRASKLIEAIEARRLLKKYGVGVLETEKELKDALALAKEAETLGKSVDEVRDCFANVCHAINYADEIHSQKYAKAVLERIEAAVAQGKLNAQLEKLHPNSNAYKEKVAIEIKKALGKMRTVLEDGKKFW